jgi:hypothetical protein
MLPADFRLAYPLFAEESDADIARWIISAGFHVDDVRFDTRYAEAVGYLVAHFAVTEKADRAAGMTESAGDITSASIMTAHGQVTQSRSPASVLRIMEDPFQATVYGRRYR